MLTAIRTLGLLLLMVSLAACQNSPVTKLYEGPERPVTEVVAVYIPETLEIVSINGQRPSGIGNRIVSVDRVIHLAPGRYQIIAFYKDIWTPQGANIHEVLRSQPVIFDVEGSAGSGFYLEYEIPETYEVARKLSESFSGWSRNRESGERVATRLSDTERPGLLSGFTIGADAASSEPSSSATNVVAPAPPVDAQKESAYLDMLKASWSQATPEERREFLRWVAE